MLTLRSFFRVINSILFTAALLACAFCGYMFYSAHNFPAADYDTQLEELAAQTEKTVSDVRIANEETAGRISALKEDLRNNGKEGAELADRIERLAAEEKEKEARLEELKAEAEITRDMQASATAARREYGEKIRELEEKILSGESDVKICYWTLDDGPSYITENFLDALDELGENVHVTFFTANQANDAPNEEELLRREILSGHSVQNHTFSHQYWTGGNVYSSIESFSEQIKLQDEWLYEVTGFHPGIFRFPGGSAWGRDLLGGTDQVLKDLGYEWIDWDCNLYDAGAADSLPSAALETQRAMTQISEKKIAVLLGHDWNMNTLLAMKSAIPKLMEQGYVFLPLFPESVTMGEVTKAV